MIFTKVAKSILDDGIHHTMIKINNLFFLKIRRIYWKNKYFFTLLLGRGREYVNRKYDKGFDISFYTPNYRSWMRAVLAHKKENITISWIKNMSENEVLWDIGANVGVFSLLAAKFKVKVVSFEPLFTNYHNLCRTIELNKDIAKLITVLPIAISNKSTVDYLFIPMSDPGYSGCAFGEPINEHGKKLNYAYKSPVLGLSGNDVQKLLPDDLADPDYIKIDVDNIEHKIIQGLGDVIKNQNLKSVLIEIDEKWVEKSNLITSILNANGFVNYITDREPTVNSPNCTTYNYIFRRK
jgi:FkbM family methyltransferase